MWPRYLSALVLWIGAVITLTVVMKWSMGVEEKFFQNAQHTQGLTGTFVLGLRILMLAGVALIQAACVMAVIPALGGGDLVTYGKGVLFVWLWYCAFVYIVVLGSLLALVGPDVFQLPATLWLILQLTASGAFLDQVLQPGFYQLGRAFPLYYTVRGNRTILFGAYYHIKEDALVLFGWLIWGLLVIAVVGTRRVERRWETLKHNLVVQSLRDTVGFSAATAPLTKKQPEMPDGTGGSASASASQKRGGEDGGGVGGSTVRKVNGEDEKKMVEMVDTAPAHMSQAPMEVVMHGS